MRARTFQILAPGIVIVQVGLIATILAIPEIQKFLGPNSAIVWAAVLALGIFAWALIPSAKRTRWPRTKAKTKEAVKAKQKPAAKSSEAKTEPPPGEVADGAGLKLAPAAVIASATANGTSTQPRRWTRVKQAIEAGVNGVKQLLGAAVGIFGEKAVASVCLALGAHLGVPSGTVMTVLNAIGIEKKVASDSERLVELEKKVAALGEIAATDKGRIDLISTSMAVLKQTGSDFQNKVSRLEDAMIRNGTKFQVEVIDRRRLPESEACKDCGRVDYSDLLGKAVSISAKYWRGQYCGAARDLTAITKSVAPLPASVANLKGNFLWRVGDLVGAEKCFAFSIQAAPLARTNSAARDARRYGYLGLAQTYCLRRNHGDVYRSRTYGTQGLQLGSRGIDVDKAADENLATVVLQIGIQHDPELKDILREELEKKTEFGRLCSMAIEKAIGAGSPPDAKLVALVKDSISKSQSEGRSCGDHVPLNCMLQEP